MEITETTYTVSTYPEAVFIHKEEAESLSEISGGTVTITDITHIIER